MSLLFIETKPLDGCSCFLCRTLLVEPQTLLQDLPQSLAYIESEPGCQHLLDNLGRPPPQDSRMLFYLLDFELAYKVKLRERA